MKKINLFLIIISILLISPVVAMTVSATFTEDVTAPEEAYTESYLTYHCELGSQLTNHVSYIDKKLTGSVTVLLEAKLGNNPDYVMGITLNDNKSTTMYSSFSSKRVITFGSSLEGYTYYDGADKKGTDISAIYNDGISESTLFYSKTTYKMDIAEDGTIDVYAKLTETKDVFLADGGSEEVYEKLSADFIKLYTLENFFSESIINSGYYLAFNVKQKILVNDVVLHHITVLDSDGGILFADNFTNYGIVNNVPTNGYYAIPSNDLRKQIGTSIIATVGDPYIVPHFNLEGISKTVYVGEEVDFTPVLVNLDESYTVTVVDGEEEILLDETNKYVFSKQGHYKLIYLSESKVNREISILVINRSTQPTVELSFDAPLTSNRVVTSNATVENGALIINDGHLLTAGMSEAFILNLKISSITEETDLSIVIGKEGDKQYSLKLTAAGVVYTDYEGQETVYACKDLVTELLNNRPVRIRVTLMGQTLSFSAIYENEQRELLGVKLFEIEDVTYVGQVGIAAENGTAALDSMQFVNLTSVKDDNTTTEAPLPEPDDDEGDDDGPTVDEPTEEPKKDIFTIIIDFFCRIFEFLFGWLF